ncbi:MAG: polysaccharide biosynthesis/export family protein [Oligoflexus sp.]|nr:polysaccharide biosynthesis/export family protein [Oligoflexus sp.]
MLRVLCLSLVLTLLNACAHATVPVAKPDLSSAPKGKTFTDWGEYIIDAGDVVSVIVEETPKLDGPQKVSPSGYISLPILGMVHAKGLTEIQLRESMILKDGQATLDNFVLERGDLIIVD